MDWWKGKRWTELPKFVLVYRSIPHISTGAKPASLKEIKDKMIELKPDRSVNNMKRTKGRDWSHKLTNKAYADDKCGAAWSPIILTPLTRDLQCENFI